jgi:hypothetical protein
MFDNTLHGYLQGIEPQKQTEDMPENPPLAVMNMDYSAR